MTNKMYRASGRQGAKQWHGGGYPSTHARGKGIRGNRHQSKLRQEGRDRESIQRAQEVVQHQ